MPPRIQIALQVPQVEPIGHARFFLLRLKQELIREVPVFNRADRTFVLSGTEGDFIKLCKILYKGGVINRKLQWVFNDGRLVILGNCLAGSVDEVEYLWFIYSLEEAAKKSGGYVHLILGDNEMAHINDDWRSRHPKYAVADFGNNAATVLYDGSNELWRWLKTKNIIEKIGSILFIHGSVSFDLLCNGLSIMEINDLVRSLVSGHKKLFSSPSLGDYLKATLKADGSDINADAKLSQMLIHLGVEKMITVLDGNERIDVFYNGSIINVHTDHLNGYSEGLLIRKRRFYKVNRGGKYRLI